MNGIPTMVSIKKASAATGISYRGIRQMIAESKITYIMVGTKYLVNLESLVSFLNGGT